VLKTLTENHNFCQPDSGVTMKELTQEQQIRRQVKKIRAFYMELLNYVGVNIVLIIIWSLTGEADEFWPKWVVLIWGMLLVIRGYRTGVFPAIMGRLHFMSEDWENRKVNEMMGRYTQDSPQHRIDARTKKGE